MSAGGGDAFVWKLDSNGNTVWATQFGSTTKFPSPGGDNSQSDHCKGIAVGNDQSVYCAGITWGSFAEAEGNIDPSYYDAFFMKLDASGSPVWGTQFGSSTTIGGNNTIRESCNGLVIDKSDNIYCAGNTTSPMGETNGGANDVILIKLNSKGELNPGSLSIGDYSFNTLTSMTNIRVGHSAEAINGKIYVIGGNQPGPINLKSVEEYDPMTDSWLDKMDMPTGRCCFGSAVYNDIVYIFGGNTTSGDISTTEAYDASLDSWQTKANMPVAARYIFALTVGNLIYVIPGAISGSAAIAKPYAYDPINDTWDNSLTSAGTFSVNGYHAYVSQNKIYFVGRTPTYVYDTVADSWSSLSTNTVGNTGNGGVSSELLNGYVFLFEPTNGATNEVEYNIISSDTWLKITGWPKPTSLNATAILDGKVYIFGGDNLGTVINDAYSFELSL